MRLITFTEREVSSQIGYIPTRILIARRGARVNPRKRKPAREYWTTRLSFFWQPQKPSPGTSTPARDRSSDPSTTRNDVSQWGCYRERPTNIFEQSETLNLKSRTGFSSPPKSCLFTSSVAGKFQMPCFQSCEILRPCLDSAQYLAGLVCSDPRSATR